MSWSFTQMISGMQATEKDETIRREQQLVQAKDRELAQAQQQLRQLRQQVIFIT